MALFSLQGCLQMEQTVTFTADGSGQHDLVMTLPESVLQEIKRSAAGNQTSTAVDPLALFNKDSVEKELKAAGIELVRHAPETIGKSRRVVIATKFSAPDALAKSPLLGSAAEWEFAGAESPLARLDRTVAYEIRILDEDGLGADMPLVGSIRVKPDAPPRVTADVQTRFVVPTA
ncbi:MAG: hypothetical protein WCR59_08700, partial [Planctomycetota bacterium]